MTASSFNITCDRISVAGTLLLLHFTYDTAIDVGRLLVDCRKYSARCGIELILAAVVSDTVYYAPCRLLYVDIGIRAHLTRNYHEARGAESLARNLGIGVAPQELIEDGIRNLI